MKGRRFVSLNVKIFCIALVAAVLPALVVGTTMYRKSIGIVEEKQEAAVKNAFRNISDTIQVNLRYAQSTSLNFIANENVRSALKLKYPTKDVLVQKKNQIAKSFAVYTGLTSYIDGIYLSGKNGIDVDIGKVNEELIQKCYEEITAAHGGAIWVWVNDDGKNKIALLREVRDIDNPNLCLGYLEIIVQSDIVQEQFSNFLKAFPGSICILDENKKEMISSGEKFPGNASDFYLESGKDFDWSNDNGSLTYCYRIEDKPWTLVSSMKASNLFAENVSLRTIFLEVILITLGLSLAAAFLFGRMITRPLKELTRQTREISRNNYKIQLDITSNDEIGILTENFNSMTRNLDELINEVLRYKMLQQEAQYNALQAQINPHFLYNNLDTAYWMSRMEKAEKTGKILLALSRLYRIAANTKEKIISVASEAEYVKEYITLQEMRLGSQIHFSFSMEEGVENLATLRFLLQPLIENSIEHGILPSGDFGQISVRIYQQDGFLYFVVEDTGNSVNVSEINELLAREECEGKRGMAIRNIAERIQIKYGRECGLFFRQASAGGIMTIVKQPAIQYEKVRANKQGADKNA